MLPTPNPDEGTIAEVDLTTGRVVRIPGVFPVSEVVAWLVVAQTGARSVHLDHATAEAYAARMHGVCKALYVSD